MLRLLCRIALENVVDSFAGWKKVVSFFSPGYPMGMLYKSGYKIRWKATVIVASRTLHGQTRHHARLVEKEGRAGGGVMPP